VSKQLKRHAQLLGYNPEWFGNHSTRIGGVTAMLEAEVQTTNVQKQGNWKSTQGIFPYWSHSDAMLSKVSTALALRPQSVSQSNAGKLHAGQLFCRSHRSVNGLHQPPAQAQVLL
jgi:hypothetical protein